MIDGVIFSELVNGVFTENSRGAFMRVIESLGKRGCDAVALVCSEIPILVPPETSPLPALDSTRSLARAAFDVACEKQPLPGWRGGPVA